MEPTPVDSKSAKSKAADRQSIIKAYYDADVAGRVKLVKENPWLAEIFSEANHTPPTKA